MILESYVRVYVDACGLNEACIFYKGLLDGEETFRFSHDRAGLEIVAISSARLSVILIAGSAESRRPFEPTRLTVRIDGLESVVAELKQFGAEQLEPVQPTPIGRKTRFRHPDGTVVEYIEADISKRVASSPGIERRRAPDRPI